MTRAELISEFDEPRSDLVGDSKTILVYPEDYKVTFVDGKDVDVRRRLSYQLKKVEILETLPTPPPKPTLEINYRFDREPNIEDLNAFRSRHNCDSLGGEGL